MTMIVNNPGYVGKPISRVDGKAKVNGEAKYAAEFTVEDLLYGYVVSSAIARGHIISIDTNEALAQPGILKVFTHENVRDTAWLDMKWKDQDSLAGHPFRPLHSNRIIFSQQPIALVIAETFEQARYGASLIKVVYEEDKPVTNLTDNIDKAFKAPKGKTGFMPPSSRGDAEKAFEKAPVKIEAEYIHGAEHHNPMEMFASTVVYEGPGKLTVYDKTQGVTNSHNYVTSVFGLSKKDVRVLSPFVGGGFGSGLRPQYQLFMACMAALEMQRSVKVVLTRQQMFSFGHRPKNIQKLKLSANEEGLLQSVEHTCYSETSQFEDYTEVVVNWSGLNYQCENVKLEYDLVKLDVYSPIDMRAPGAVTGQHALESAIDELAYKLKMDPLEFRIKNYSYEDQNEKKPFSSKELMKCYTEGAESFGWKGRPIEPRSMKRDNLLIGWGMATGCWDAQMQKSSAKAVLGPNGNLNVTSGASDIGPGTYTVMTQIAADTLGMNISDVKFELGDSLMPEAPLQGGSWTVASVGSAVKMACENIGKQLLKAAHKEKESPLADETFETVVFKNGLIVSNIDESKAVSIKSLLEKQEGNIEETATAAPNLINKLKYSFNTHCATFVEVEVDEDLGTIKVSRIVSAVAAGKIMNTKTARSQVLGAAVWGISQALEEDSIMDHNEGRFMNHNLAEYHVAVNADIHQQEVIFVDEVDGIVNPLGAKGLGEIGIVGVAGAVANAVFHATGKRVRKLPITLDTLL